MKRKRITQLARDQSLKDLVTLPIETDGETDIHVWGKTVLLADRYSLTVYDATYLELAQRRSLPLATLDRDLRKAAQAENIHLLGL